MEKLLEKFNNKKLIENLVIFLILAIIVMIVINSLFKGENKENENKVNYVQNISKDVSYDNSLEERLENILSLISGAGKVNVMISYLNQKNDIPMTDTKVTTTIISEKDSNGGERKTEETNSEETIIYEQNSSDKSPVIKQSILPEVVGVIVVAEGANNSIVKENLVNAVSAVISVPSHRIQVFAR